MGADNGRASGHTAGGKGGRPFLRSAELVSEAPVDSASEESRLFSGAERPLRPVIVGTHADFPVFYPEPHHVCIGRRALLLGAETSETLCAGAVRCGLARSYPPCTLRFCGLRLVLLRV
ncbi:hypothetical protein MTO96_003183 [Rhipicephalus appendiculatus]